MSSRLDDAAVPPAPHDYIRGGGGVEIDRGRLARIVAGLILVTLVVMALVLAVQAAGDNARTDRLHAQGVPVQVTVTGCVAMASGTGITEYGWNCRGTFTLAGRTHDEAIGGTADLYQPGQQLAAVTVPGDTAILFPAAMVAGMRSGAGVFVLPAGLALVAALIAVAVVRMRRRPSRTSGDR